VDPIVARILEDAARRGWLEPGEGIAAACSGGADSVFLLRALSQARAKRPLRLVAVHVHHAIRGAEADEDAAFVEKLAADLEVEHALARVDVPAERARRGKGSIETVARELRYRALAEEAFRLGLRTVATGHHRDDLLETVLLGLLRGGGLRAIRGIPRERPLGRGLRVVRPLLDVSREEILRGLRESGFSWREDPSNVDVGPLRNRIRGRLLPLLREIGGPSLEPSLVRLALDAQEVEDFLARESQKRLASSAQDLSPPLADLPALLRRRMARDFLERASGAPVSRSILDRVDDLLREPGEFLVSGPAGLLVRAEGGSLRIVRDASAPQRAAPVPLAVPGETQAMGHVFHATLEDTPPAAAPSPLEAFFDPGAVGELFVRPRRPGDRFRPAGMPGSKKLSDFFIDRKVPRATRDSVPIVVSGDRVVWVVGHAAHEEFLAREGAAPVLRLRARRSG
jgi:tRNA(Ile)-lysidine synthase